MSPGGGSRRRGFGSVFAKLMMVLVGAGLVLNFSLYHYHRVYGGEHHEGFFHENMENYFDYLVEDLGYPPDRSKAEHLLRKYSIALRYEGPDGTWATSNDVPDISEALSMLGRKKFREGFVRRGHFYFLAKRGESKYLFSAGFGRALRQDGWYMAGVVAIFAGILIGTYLGIRWVLKPLRWLDKGVAELSRGNLEHQIPVRWRKDELGQLATSFNEMAGKIKEMIKSRDQLLLDVSHELRSPLTRMRVALELIPDNGEKESIKEDIDILEGMVSEILETERLNSVHGKLKIRMSDLARLIADGIRSFEGRKPGIVIKEMDDRLAAALDDARFRLVLKNLLENAFKYSGEDSPPVEISAVKDGEVIRIVIRDHGQGIPPEDIPHLFEPFYRADKSRYRDNGLGGYGLGLSLCKKIIDAHGGTLSIRNAADGDGAEVVLTLKG